MTDENKMIGADIDEKDITTVVADDLEIKGTIKFKSSVMLKGIFEGEIQSEGLLVVGPTAKVTATITTKNLISHGEITGNVIAHEQELMTIILPYKEGSSWQSSDESQTMKKYWRHSSKSRKELPT